MTRDHTRTQLQRLWPKILAQNPDAAFDELCEAIAAKLAKNVSFVENFVDDHLLDVVHSVGRAAQADATRSVVALDEDKPRRLSRKQRAELVASTLSEVASGYAKWMEVDPSTKRRIPLIDMTRTQIFAAADARRESSVHEMRNAEWLRLIGEGMSDGQFVRDAWPDERLRELHETLRVSYRPLASIAGSALDQLSAGENQ
jgi:hypothetical protein